MDDVSGMSDEEIRSKLYEIFPELVLEYGLSVMEAVCFGLSQVIGLGPTATAEYVTRMMGKNLRPTDVGSFTSKAKNRMAASGTIYLDPYGLLDSKKEDRE